MKKLFLQGSLLVLLFTGIWFGLTRIEWVEVFEIRKKTDQTEVKLGDLFWSEIKKDYSEEINEQILEPIDSIFQTICTSNGIEPKRIKYHILLSDEINAFALPDRRIIIFTGLLKDCKNPEELAGVLGHEISHIELNHLMKKLAKDIGISVLISMTTGESGAEVIKEITGNLTSLAFDREMEHEADKKAVEYLLNADINPKPFADFLYRLSLVGEEFPVDVSWLSTHPNSKDRAELILSLSSGFEETENQILSDSLWTDFQQNIHSQIDL